MQGVLTPTIKLLSFGSPGGLPSPHFGSVSLILTLSPSEVATNELVSSELNFCEKHKIFEEYYYHINQIFPHK
jgi:hypothetical protein